MFCSGPLCDQIGRGGREGGATDPNLRDGGRQETKYLMGMAQALQNKETVKIACMPYLSAQNIISF